METQLVLIPKPKKTTESDTTYRPIGMLSSLGKLLERLVGNRLTEEIEKKNGISARQFGFRKEMSTIDALNKVMELTNKAKEGSYKSKKLSVIVVFDVKNAFNTVQ